MSSIDQVFWNPDRHRRNIGDHPHYKFKWYFDQINKDVLPDPVKHLRRPVDIGARFPVEVFPWSEYKPNENNSSNNHPDWKGWRVSEPYMNNLTNGWKVYMGEVRPDTSAPIFYPPFEKGWIIPFEVRPIELKPTTSCQGTERIPVHLRDFEDRPIIQNSTTSRQGMEQIPVHLRDLHPYITPEEMRARKWREKVILNISDVNTWGQLRPIS